MDTGIDVNRYYVIIVDDAYIRRNNDRKVFKYLLYYEPNPLDNRFFFKTDSHECLLIKLDLMNMKPDRATEFHDGVEDGVGYTRYELVHK